ncbi:MAG: alpha/beta hydrolase [Janthinobacterium lividum]
MPEPSSRPTVVLVHGAFVDASGYAGVIRELQQADLDVLAPPNPLRSVATDAASIRSVIAAIPGPVVLVGHSYGGAIITKASVGLENVQALVYLAGFGLDVDESVLSVQEPFAPSLLVSNARPSSYEAPGAAGGPDLYIDTKTFRETFCADVPADVAAVLAVSQRPVAAATLNEQCTAAGWKTIPSWFLVSAQDNTINPEAEQFMASRMGATTETINASHLAFVSRPVETAAFILSALK